MTIADAAAEYGESYGRLRRLAHELGMPKKKYTRRQPIQEALPPAVDDGLVRAFAQANAITQRVCLEHTALSADQLLLVALLIEDGHARRPPTTRAAPPPPMATAWTRLRPRKLSNATRRLSPSAGRGGVLFS